MRRHGATVVGANLHEVIFRSIYSARNAEHQWRAHALGGVGALTAGEASLASGHNLQPGPVERAWEYWAGRLEKTEALVAAAKATKPATRARASARSNPRKTGGRVVRKAKRQASKRAR
jgi:hypothetical protein